MIVNGYTIAAYANLRDANLQGANLQGANLQGANLRGAILWDATLWDATLWGADLGGANLQGADLRGANLSDANLRGADLRDADLRDANLWGADLWYANLRGANLRGANLRDAYLQGAYLRGARGLIRPRVYESRGGWLYAYKSVVPHGDAYTGPQYPGIVYRLGETISVDGADTSEARYAFGINLATLEWCRNNYPDATVLRVRFRKADIATVPYASDGKFRVRRCTPVEVVRAD